MRKPDGTCLAMMSAMLPNLITDVIRIGVGIPTMDEKLPKKMYSDVVTVGMNGDWVLNQWLPNEVIMEPVPHSIRNRSVNMQGCSRANERTIGVHFARFGYPARSFTSIFHILDSAMPGLVDSLVMAVGYYQANASWRVTQTPGMFVCMTEQGTRMTTCQSLRGDGHDGHEALTYAYGNRGHNVIANTAKYEFSVKCHNFFSFELADYYGPPHTSAIGMMLNVDFMKILNKGKSNGVPSSQCPHLLKEVSHNKRANYEFNGTGGPEAEHSSVQFDTTST
ncbi:hypothetical protein GB937_001344 [Aspergillus fischeri]|nr:hypothetical protein GB937_001344 [Aspergillus fischeri]